MDFNLTWNKAFSFFLGEVSNTLRNYPQSEEKNLLHIMYKRTNVNRDSQPQRQRVLLKSVSLTTTVSTNKYAAGRVCRAAPLCDYSATIGPQMLSVLTGRKKKPNNCGLNEKNKCLCLCCKGVAQENDILQWNGAGGGVNASVPIWFGIYI